MPDKPAAQSSTVEETPEEWVDSDLDSDSGSEISLDSVTSTPESQADGDVAQAAVSDVSEDDSPEKSDPHDPPPKFNSYREYISYLRKQNEHFEWLDDFFQHVPDETHGGNQLMLETVEGRLRRRKVNLKTLQSRPRGLSTRIIIFSYEEVWRVDRNLLDDVCFALDLDPVVLWQHLDHDYSHLDGPGDRKIDRNGIIINQLLSEKVSLDMKIDQYGNERIAAIIMGARDDVPFTTVLILCQAEQVYQPHFPLEGNFSMHDLSRIDASSRNGKMPQQYKETLKTWTRDQILAADRTPILFIYPYVRLLHHEAGQALEKARLQIIDMIDPNLAAFWEMSLTTEEETLFEISTMAEDLGASLTSFEKFRAVHDPADLPETVQTASNWRYLLEKTTRLKEIMRDRVNRRAQLLSLEESRKSIQMANSFNTLTQLAFVFVPLTFSVSIFGANLKVMGSGTVRLWPFAVTVISISVFTAVIWWWFTGSLTDTITRISRNLWAMIRFGLRSPSGALSLWLYSLCHLPASTEKKLQRLTLLERPEGAKGLHKIRMSDWEAKDGDSMLEAYWRRKLLPSAQFLDRETWREDMFYRRWENGKVGQEGEPSEKTRPHSTDGDGADIV